MAEATPGSTPRCLAVVSSVTAAGAAVLATAWPATTWVVPRPDRSFEELLTGGCAVAALVAMAWLWLAVVAVALEARRTRGRGNGPRGVPPAVRRVVLLACGIALAGAATPAVAGEQPRTTRPPVVPEQAPSTAAWVARALHDARPTPTADAVVVRPGDSLWGLASAALPSTADTAQVTRHWHRIHDLNRAVIGDDPDLIHPGQRLRLPPAPQEGAP
ncbi:LysM peptidoglycan-binding domain-containing protein [Nocardioides sp. SYSU DS0663]|uniref:LysM peptidoglycan-binding domain-containing protein n=1 Tax=Nocardioides sp. SYSU DS0663 TaxID=3416445 RepID=UPI003F4C048E